MARHTHDFDGLCRSIYEAALQPRTRCERLAAGVRPLVIGSLRFPGEGRLVLHALSIDRTITACGSSGRERAARPNSPSRPTVSWRAGDGI